MALNKHEAGIGSGDYDVRLSGAFCTRGLNSSQLVESPSESNKARRRSDVLNSGTRRRVPGMLATFVGHQRGVYLESHSEPLSEPVVVTVRQIEERILIAGDDLGGAKHAGDHGRGRCSPRSGGRLIGSVRDVHA